MRSCVASGAVQLLMVTALAAHGQSTWHVEKTFAVGGAGGFDYITVDAKGHRLFVPRGTHAQVIDSESGKLLGDIPGIKGAHGIAIVPGVNRGFATQGQGEGGLLVFDLKTYAVLGSLPAMADADGVIYDEAADRVLVSAGDSEALLVYKPSADLKTGKPEVVKLGGKPEFLAADGDTVFVNLEDKDLVAKVDLKTLKVIAKYPVAPGGKPVGLSIDRAAHKLFIGCRGPQKLVVMSTVDGKIEGSVDIGAGVDATAYGKGEAFASCRDGSLTVAGDKGGSFAVIQTVQTAVGAKTLGIDAEAGKIYLPTTDYVTVANGKPAAKPEGFKIVVVSK
ncbi:DNA-binding beta-propeller fold protein YncE [Bryocella elongata]|uniref:DNA-binding beta-propeller fold protein YncE n=1 Tax=Bryocella elongata TaxID=863522 RepID=A0A1H5XW95_9BACT|nr:DNA-binding beta-propeller fold protein YncE [Bryocella elongata]